MVDSYEIRVSKEEVKAAMKRIEAKKMVSPDDLCGGGDVYEREQWTY